MDETLRQILARLYEVDSELDRLKVEHQATIKQVVDLLEQNATLRAQLAAAQLQVARYSAPNTEGE